VLTFTAGAALNIALLAFGARRLLGEQRFSLSRTVVAGLAGQTAGNAIINALAAGEPASLGAKGGPPYGVVIGFVALGWACALLIAMAILVVWQAFVPAGTVPPPTSWPGRLRARAARSARYWQIVRIFTRCGLSYVAVEAHSGAMGGSASTEFMVRTDAGEDDVAHCATCGYAANIERATSAGPIAATTQGEARTLAKFPTPGVKTIEDLAAPPFARPATQQLKTLVYMADGALLLAIVRGDDELNEAKLQTASGAQLLRPALAEEIAPALGAKPGSLGGVGVVAGQGKIARLFVDRTLSGAIGMVTGANADGFHLEGVDVGRDLAGAELIDLRKVKAGEACPSCGKGTLALFKALEIGHIFKLGTKYSDSLGARVLDEQGREVPIVMGSYGIGVERIAAGIEASQGDRLDGTANVYDLDSVHLRQLF